MNISHIMFERNCYSF